MTAVEPGDALGSSLSFRAHPEIMDAVIAIIDSDSIRLHIIGLQSTGQ